MVRVCQYIFFSFIRILNGCAELNILSYKKMYFYGYFSESVQEHTMGKCIISTACVTLLPPYARIDFLATLQTPVKKVLSP